MRGQFRFRIRIVFFGILAVALIIAGRLYYLQIMRSGEYAEEASRQHVAKGLALFDRGSMYFTRKDGTLMSAASLATGYAVGVNPQKIADPEAAYAALAEVASVDREAFFAATEKKRQVYVEVVRRLPEEAGKALAAKRIPGIELQRARWRTYPGDALASATIGIVSYGGTDTLAGRTGLEVMYDDTLTRANNSLYKNFFAKIFSQNGGFFVDAKEKREGNLVTAIEPAVLTRLASDLARVHEKYGSKETGGIIMDPRTGAIIALGTIPSFDPDDGGSMNPDLLVNPLVEHVYEFGSIMKPLTVAAGLDSGVITPESTYYDTGCIKVDAATICNFDGKARGTADVQKILSQSLNLGVSWIATELGQERFRSYFMKLFSEKTGVDLPGESGSLLQNLREPQQVGYDTAAFGQGIAVTPMQMIRALAALANEGALPPPHIGKAVRLDSGEETPFPAREAVPVFSPDAVREVSAMLTNVVDTDLRGGSGKIASLSVAAKTGTAQLVQPGGGYYKDRYFHSFFGYFPSHAPRFIILLYTNDPQGVQYASETLTSTFMDLTRFLIEYYRIPPDRGASIAPAV